MNVKELETYELIEQRYIADVQSEGLILRHKKSGARVVVLSNEDDNKVFYIGFKTPPEDETGVPHIIEHTVLCGSDKFPVKDPFVELVKGSLNTFLNAMTYSDKTVYPVASCNTQDFHNLMDVYLDAVFHPNITKYKEIFMQEGWHYELEEEDAPITINGVVYNEMKGAYSSPERVLADQINKTLFPDNAYSKSSGGNPKYIPTLTYETYLDFYQRYYHPQNSYIYLYGNMDVAERLDWMDREYLSSFERGCVDSEIKKQPAFSEMKYAKTYYPISTEDSEEDQTYLAYNKVVADGLDKELYQAFDVLDYALVSAPGAPIKQALIDAGIGQDVSGGFDSGILQNVFSIIVKNTNLSEQERFVTVIEDTLKKLVENGLDQKALLAGINSSEFRFREADFGSFPKGLLYGLQCLDSWLFCDEKPFMHLECLETFAFLKSQIETGYFEEIIQKYLLENTHGSVVAIVPKKGLLQQEEKELQAQLKEYKESLTKEERAALIRQTAQLKAYQEEPSPEEELQKIPMLTRADMKKEATPFSNEEKSIEKVPVILHDYETNGIDYITLLFEAEDVDACDIPLMGFLRSVLGFVDTASCSYAQLANEINIYTGGITSNLGMYPDVNNIGKQAVKYEIHLKTLGENRQKGLDLVDEIINHSKLTDMKRLRELIAQTKSRMQQNLSDSGHTVAAYRALSNDSVYGWYRDSLQGIRYYQGILALDRQMKEDPQKVVGRLEKLVQKLFAKNRLVISFTAGKKEYEEAIPALKAFLRTLPEESTIGKATRIEFDKKKEAFCDASQIQYVARAGNFWKHGFSYNGYLQILKMVLGYDYLWIHVRVKGGAYGCMNSYTRTGDCFFVSYRDPNLAKTNEVFEKIPEYLRNFNPDERDMTKYIIGTFGSIDTPLYPEGKGSRSMTAYLQNLSFESVQKERQQILTAQPEDIRNLAELVQSVLSEDLFCVIGNENTIKAEAEKFDVVKGLYEE